MAGHSQEPKPQERQSANNRRWQTPSVAVCLDSEPSGKATARYPLPDSEDQPRKNILCQSVELLVTGRNAEQQNAYAECQGAA